MSLNWAISNPGSVTLNGDPTGASGPVNVSFDCSKPSQSYKVVATSSTGSATQSIVVNNSNPPAGG